MNDIAALVQSEDVTTGLSHVAIASPLLPRAYFQDDSPGSMFHIHTFAHSVGPLQRAQLGPEQIVNRLDDLQCGSLFSTPQRKSRGHSSCAAPLGERSVRQRVPRRRAVSRLQSLASNVGLPLDCEESLCCFSKDSSRCRVSRVLFTPTSFSEGAVQDSSSVGHHGVLNHQTLDVLASYFDVGRVTASTTALVQELQLRGTGSGIPTTETRVDTDSV